MVYRNIFDAYHSDGNTFRPHKKGCSIDYCHEMQFINIILVHETHIEGLSHMIRLMGNNNIAYYFTLFVYAPNVAYLH